MAGSNGFETLASVRKHGFEPLVQRIAGKASKGSGEESLSQGHVALNRVVWDSDAENWVVMGERLWAAESLESGNWGKAGESLKLLPSDMTDMDAVELGCGTEYVSCWMARRGARVTARRLSGTVGDRARTGKQAWR